MRTLVIFHLPYTNGISRSLESGVRRLSDLGPVDVLVPGIGDIGTTFGDFATVGSLEYSALTLPGSEVSVVRLPVRLIRELMVLRTHIRATRPDVVIVASAMLPAAVAAARAERRAVVVYAAEIFHKGHEESIKRAIGAQLLARFTGVFSDAVMCCSDAVARQYRPTSSTVVSTIYPPISRRYADGDRSAFRVRHGIGESEFCIAAVGSISRGRGQDVLLRAIPQIRRQVPHARCVIQGVPHDRAVDVAFHDELVELTDELGIVDSVVFTGFSERVADVYAASDVVVNPARFNEPFGRVVYEALVAGRPVVCADVGGVRELLRHERNALLFPREDAGALAHAIVRLAEDHALRARLVRHAQQETLCQLAEAASDDRFVDLVLRATREHVSVPPAC